MLCRHDSQGDHQVTQTVEWMRHLTMNQWHSLFGAWHEEDEALPMGPQPLRLSRIMHLPPVLPHPKKPLAPGVGTTFTATQAFKRLAVSLVTK